MPKRYQTKAFSLIELLVTVAIVSILSSIAVINYAAFRQRANDAVAINQVQNIRVAQAALFADHPGLSLNAIGALSIESQSDGTYLISNNIPDFSGLTTIEQVLPGFAHDPKVYISAYVAYSNVSGDWNIYGRGAHCMGTVMDAPIAGYEGTVNNYHYIGGGGIEKQTSWGYPMYGDCP